MTMSTICFCDLAGSEPMSQAAGTEDARKGHIKYRESKLTRILQSSLNGNARMALVCNISPAATSVDQSMVALKFANAAKNIVMRPVMNAVVDDKAVIRRIMAENQSLKAQLTSVPQVQTSRADELNAELCIKEEQLQAAEAAAKQEAALEAKELQAAVAAAKQEAAEKAEELKAAVAAAKQEAAVEVQKLKAAAAAAKQEAAVEVQELKAAARDRAGTADKEEATKKAEELQAALKSIAGLSATLKTSQLEAAQQVEVERRMKAELQAKAAEYHELQRMHNETLIRSEDYEHQLESLASLYEEQREQQPTKEHHRKDWNAKKASKDEQACAAKGREDSKQLVELKKQLDEAEAVSVTAAKHLATAKAELKADAAQYTKELAQMKEEMGIMFSAAEAALVEQQGSVEKQEVIAGVLATLAAKQVAAAQEIMLRKLEAQEKVAAELAAKHELAAQELEMAQSRQDLAGHGAKSEVARAPQNNQGDEISN
eukprot:gene8532-4882_t